MQKADRCYWPVAVMLVAVLGVVTATAAAGKSPGTDGSSVALIVLHPGGAIPGTFDRERSDCRRYGVIWSGGTALRRPGRISPRPVRSRWQGAAESRIRCAEDGAFEQRRVADQPWIH